MDPFGFGQGGLFGAKNARLRTFFLELNAPRDYFRPSAATHF
jgi:hypothetical protein